MEEMKTELFWYKPEDCSPADGSMCITLQERKNGELIYDVTPFIQDVGWFTEDQSFVEKPKVLKWAFLPPASFMGMIAGEK